MASSYRRAFARDPTPLPGRLSGMGLALGINLLILLALLTIGVRTLPERPPSEAIVVDLLPQSSEPKQRSREAESAARPATPAEPVEPPPLVPPPRVELPAPAAPREVRLPMIELTREDFAAADIGKLPKSAQSGSAGDSEEVGRGPHGEILYAAEWARRPTDAELGGYLPPNAPAGYGVIACRTAPENRVEDCIELGQSPLGSRLASAVRQAAWQFRVRPPRKNGRPMIGEWVRIRIEYTR